MFRLLNKECLFATLALFCMTNLPLMAWDDYDCCCESNRFYLGAFGGGLYSNSTTITQFGTAFFTEAEGGPLAVFAKGRTKHTSSGFGGLQVGYELSANPLSFGCCSDWSIAFALETEAFWYGHTKKGHLTNLISLDRLPEHDFLTSFHLHHGVYLANAVISLKNCCYEAFSPYIGGGIGATRITIRNASSIQTEPPEVGINHFNSKRTDTSWAFAAQAKAGLRYNICNSFHIFGEYRYLYVDFSNYLFGSTDHPTHAPTSPWNVKVDKIQYNAFVFGVQYDL